MSSLTRLWHTAVLLCAAFLIPSLAAAQQTLRVPQDYSTIQSAIDASHSGDSVVVSAGTYVENLVIDSKQITLIAADGPAKTTLDGGQLGPVLKITNTPGMQTAVAGFTVQHGLALDGPGEISTGIAGVLLINAGASITGNTFTRNIGAEVGIINASAILVSNIISTAPNNQAACLASTSPGQGAPTGVYLSGTSTVLGASNAPVPSVLSANTISGDGTACSGVGVAAYDLGQPVSLQNNVLRGNAVGIVADTAALTAIQNLIYDNASGALHLTSHAASPNVNPATTQLINNTIVNNLAAPSSTQSGPIADIYLDGTAARTAFVNNVLVGGTAHPVLTCAVALPSYNDTPLLFDHNDLYNLSNAADSLATGDCFPGLTNALAENGNLSTDPHLAGATDLHPLPGSPLIEAGNNSAPGLLYVPFTTGASALDLFGQPATSLLQTPFSTGPITLLSAPTDFSGSARLNDGTGTGTSVVDIGAYESAAANSPVIASPTATLLSASSYFTAPGTVLLSASTTTTTGFNIHGALTFKVNGSDVSTVIVNSSGPARLPPSTLSLPLSSPGLYTITAAFVSATPATAGSESPVLYIRVTAATAPVATTLSIAASPAAQVVNQPVTLTIHLGSISSDQPAVAGPVPPGDVTLFDAGNLITVLQPDASGYVTYVVTKPSAGNHVYTVSYAGTTSYAAATASTTVSVTSPLATVLTSSISPTSAALGMPVELSAKVACTGGAATPTGAVSFSDGATLLGSAALVSGAASLTTSTLTQGLHTIRFTYTPDPAFSGSTATSYVTVGGVPTTILLTAGPASPSTRDTVHVTVTVTNSDPSSTEGSPQGSVSLSDGASLLASNPYPTPGGVLVLNTTLSTAGVHQLTATFTPATSTWRSSSASFDLTVSPAPTFQASLTASPASPSLLTDAITLSLTITPASIVPAGSAFRIFDGPTELGSGLISSSVPTASLTLSQSALSAGLHSFHTLISGPLLLTPVSSNTVVQQITRVPTVLSLLAAPATRLMAGSSVTLSAVLVSPGQTTQLPLAGTIVFLDGATVLGATPLTADGQASLSLAALSSGAHHLSASYAGSTTAAPATSSDLIEVVDANPTSTSLTVAPVTASAFSPVLLSAHVSSSTSTAAVNLAVCAPACVPASVTFFADSASGRTTLGTAALNAAGSASLTTTSVAGVYSITAVFNGTPIFAASASSSLALVLTPASTSLVLTASPIRVYQNQLTKIGAVLTAAGVPASAISGTVTFSEGSTNLGSTALASAGDFTYTPADVGTHTLTAAFSGNGTLAGSSATTTVTVLPSDFVVTVKDSTLTIPTEHHVATAVTVTTTGAMADLIDVSCSNLPPSAHCILSPATLDLTQGNTASATLTLDTDALLNYARAQPTASPTIPAAGSRLVAACILLLPTALLIGTPRIKRRSRGIPRLLSILLVGILGSALSGCSGLYPAHVSPGTYAIKLSGRARATNVEHSTTLTLVITR